MSRINHFDNDVKIIHIGNLFRYADNHQWYIEVWCKPYQKKKSTRFVNLPLLSRNRILNNTLRRDEKYNEEDKIITFESDYTLHTCKLSEFDIPYDLESVKKTDGLQNAFLYETQKSKIVIPQLELAKSLFLVNSYFCKACLSPNSIALEFDVRHARDRYHADVHVLKTTTFPKSAFDQKGLLKQLAWLLTDPIAMASFRSIYKHYQKNRTVTELQERWCFSFEPPSMVGWSLHVKGRSVNSESLYIVDEIVGVEFDVDIPDSVAFIHPSFVRPLVYKQCIDESASQLVGFNNDFEVEIDDEETASDQAEPVVLEKEIRWTRFKQDLNTYKVVERSTTRTFTVQEKFKADTPTRVSTDEPFQGGELPAATVGGVQDQTELEAKYASRFIAFDEMVSVLIERYDCKLLEKSIKQLERHGKSKQHMLSTKERRCIRSVRLRYRSIEVVLLEIDTSDGIKMLSTKLIINPPKIDWEDDFLKIRKNVVSHSITWPNELLDDLFGKKYHTGINHPKQQGGGSGLVPVESIDGWAARLKDTLDYYEKLNTE